MGRSGNGDQSFTSPEQMSYFDWCNGQVMQSPSIFPPQASGHAMCLHNAPVACSPVSVLAIMMFLRLFRPLLSLTDLIFFWPIFNFRLLITLDHGLFSSPDTNCRTIVEDINRCRTVRGQTPWIGFCYPDLRLERILGLSPLNRSPSIRSPEGPCETIDVISRRFSPYPRYLHPPLVAPIALQI